MRRVLVLLLVLGALVLPALASAHPLGNFTVNRYSELTLSGERIYVLYVLDMAEIPTFQERQKIADEGAYGRALVRRIARELRLTVDGRLLALRPLEHRLSFPPGQGGLATLRLEATYEAGPVTGGAAAQRLRYADRNYASRIGWKEIVVGASSGARLVSTDAARETITDRLRAYPQDLLQSPLDVTEARARFVPGAGAGSPPGLAEARGEETRVGTYSRQGGGFAKLIAENDLSAGFVLVSLFVAMFWGAAHAFSPGHGKAIVAAYLVGTRGTPRHAVLLGLIVTVTHTIGVFALGLVTLALSEFIVPDDLYPWLNLVSALLVVTVGLGVLRWRLADWRRARDRVAGAHHHGHHHHDHSHGGDHDHHDDHHDDVRHAHSHAPEPGTGLRGLLGVGISGGIIPCPTALVVLLAAISLHRVGYGLVLILAFSVGLAAAMTGIGLLAVTAKRAFSRVDFQSSTIRLLPAVSALVILGLGIAMTVRALPSIT